MIFERMKKVIKIGYMMAAVLALASCSKTTGLDSVVPSNVADHGTRVYHDGTDGVDTGAGIGTSLFTDKDKCKKCHGGGATSGKSVSINWNAPYMSNGEYSSIEELIDNYDFVNNVHLRKNSVLTARVQPGVTAEQKQQLINYLKTLEAEAAMQHKN